MKTALLIVAILAAAGLAALLGYNTLTGPDPARWHRPVRLPASVPGDWPLPNGHLAAVLTGLPPGAALDRVAGIVAATPRTRLLAGDPDAGRMTFVTATPALRFRDFATVEAIPRGAGTLVAIFARSELGGSDFGVNRARVRAWLDEARLTR